MIKGNPRSQKGNPPLSTVSIGAALETQASKPIDKLKGKVNTKGLVPGRHYLRGMEWWGTHFIPLFRGVAFKLNFESFSLAVQHSILEIVKIKCYFSVNQDPG